jgi:predicted  nucleic acid-binding Zn-ribbon protein
MGTLKSMVEFIETSISTASEIDEKLNKIQAHFNTNFNNVIKVRTAEIEFLQNEFFKDPDKFPREVRDLYKESLIEQGKKFKQNLSKLEEQNIKLDGEIKELSKNSHDYFAKIKKVNTDLDNKEERLKSDINTLEEEISAFNKKIDELNTGFGFITNFFGMKKIEKEKEVILKKRNDLLSEIEKIRSKWGSKEEELLELDSKTRDKWNDLYTEFSMTSEKIKNLTTDMDLLIKKATFSNSLAVLHGDEKFLLTAADSKRSDRCRKCSSKNEKNLFFCDFCGEPFSENRKDIEGSLIETGELNIVFRSLTDGLKQSVSFIALIRGIKEGMNTFLKSVKDVKKTEDTYSELPTLKIDVPEISMKFAGHLKELEKKLETDFSKLHPAEFASIMFKETETLFTIKNIETYFTAMGDELNKRTKEQW